MEGKGTELGTLICQTWPRLYLDTGDMLDIADGRADSAVVSELVAATGDRGVVLVVGWFHFQDVLAAETDSLERLADALEQFRFLAVAMAGPEQVELADTDADDITLQLAGNIRELLRVSANAPAIEETSALLKRAHETQVAIRGLPDAEAGPFPRRVGTSGCNV
jgi:hypothetical protein